VRRPSRLATAACLGALLLVSALAYMPFCALAHRCGCSWPWRGSAVCNVHVAAGPHCPWCEHRSLGAAAALGIPAGQWLVFRRLRRRGLGPGAAVLGAAASFALVAPLAALLLWLPTDYPHFFVPDLRARLGVAPGPLGCHPPRSR